MTIKDQMLKYMLEHDCDPNDGWVLMLPSSFERYRDDIAGLNYVKISKIFSDPRFVFVDRFTSGIRMSINMEDEAGNKLH